MTLPANGSISMSQVATELGISQTGLSLNDARVRALAGVLSGPISFSNLHGKTKLSVTANNVLVTSTDTGTVPVAGMSIATPVGGTAPYTYSWVFVSGVMFIVSLSNRAPEVATFAITLSPGEVRSAIYRVTVTDANGISASTQITVDLSGTPI